MRTVTLCGETLPHPGHVCAFFDSRVQKYETLIPFLLDAITAGDEVINIVDASDREAHLQTLSEGGVPVHAAKESGALTVLSSEETYLLPGEDTLPRLLDFLRDKLGRARNEKRCLRTWGEMNWVERSEVRMNDVLEYEARVNELFPDFECTLVCVYDLARVPATLITDILATHPSAIINGRLRKNAHYVEPHEYLDMLRARDTGYDPRNESRRNPS